MSKTALSGLTKVLSQDLGAENIRVNCIAPGTIKTKFGSPMFDTEEMKHSMLSIIALRRWVTLQIELWTVFEHFEMIFSHMLVIRLGEPKDIAGIIAFLASEDAAYISGETIIAAGGAPSRL